MMVQNNAVDGNNTNIEDAMQRLKLHAKNHQEGTGAQSRSYPDRPGEPNCLHYLRTGICGYGSSCRFNHPTNPALGALHGGELPERAGEPDCGFYLKTGTCKYGPSCKYNHPKDRHGAAPVSFNILGLPLRQEEKSCPYYMRTGYCKFGPACKFNHPPPASPGTRTAPSGPVESSIVPPSSLAYIGSFPAWSPLSPSYLSAPHIRGVQAYVPPIVVSPSPGILPAQGWNTYMGNMAPASSVIAQGSTLAYNSRYVSEFDSSGQVQLFPPLIPHLPERPDQPECRNFMNNGICKYGPDCRYNHPKERTAQLSLNTIGPQGLPSRPGLPVCSHYNLFGLCQYGAACEFDHPFRGYSYSHNFSPSPIPIYVPHLIYPGNSPNAPSSETSPSKTAQHPDWVQKPTTTSNGKLNMDTKSSKVSHEHVVSPNACLRTTAEPHDTSH